MRSDTQIDYRERLLRVMVYIQNHLDEPLPLDDLAKVACFSPFHFHRIFRGIVGESVKEHVRRLRRERAAFRLTSTNRSVIDIALDAGYDTHESFTRAFGRMFDMSPSAYRQKCRGDRATVASKTAASMWERQSTMTTGDETVEVRLENCKPIRVAFVRHVGPYRECVVAWEKLCSFAAEQGWLSPDVRCLGISYDDPEITEPENLRYDLYAIVTHRGPYESLKKTYRQFYREWVPTCGRELRSDPCLEVYQNDPRTTRPEDLLTDIYVPLAS